MRPLRILALCLAGGGAPLSLLLAQTASDPVVAQSGGLSITASVARRLLETADPTLREQVAKDSSAMGRLIRGELAQQLLAAQAHDAKWDAKPDVVFRADQARQAVIANSFLASQAQLPADYPSEADIQTAYDANKAKFVVPRQFHLAQIFVAAPQNAPKPEEDEAQHKLKDIRDRLGKRGADYAAIARQYSDDHVNGEKGGDIGWLREDQLVPVIREAVAGVAENANAEPVRVADGYHIMRVLGTRPAGPAPIADVRDELIKALKQNRTNELERAYVEELLKRQPIQINEIELQKVAK